MNISKYLRISDESKSIKSIYTSSDVFKRCYEKLMETLSKILCKWKQDSVISSFLYLDSVLKDNHKLVHKFILISGFCFQR